MDRKANLMNAPSIHVGALVVAGSSIQPWIIFVGL
jgi:hypothetical protein